MSNFVERVNAPEKGNKYYTQKAYGGYSMCRLGKYDSSNPLKWPGCVMPNCVGYACGRFNEIEGNKGSSKAWNFYNNACTFITAAKNNGYKTGTIPAVGAIIVWGGGSEGAGHVAVVEQVRSSTEILVSESGFVLGYGLYFRRKIHKLGSNKQWTAGEDAWMTGSSTYTFLGFVYSKNYSPSSLDVDKTNASSIATATTATKAQTTPEITQAEIDAYNKKVQEAYAAAQKKLNSKGIDLLSSSSLVESPFIIVKIGNYTFGSYTKIGSLENTQSTMTVDYPNYMQSITINKTNGTLNVYEIQMLYQIRPGEDPNLLDRIFSTISDSREVTLTYGDWCAPSFIYREEKAILTKVTSRINFASQNISYTLSCTSQAISNTAQTQHFPAHMGSNKIKVSELITKLLADKTNGLTDTFTAMKDAQFIADNGLIPTDDKAVEIEAQSMTIVQYLNYIVGCMTSSTNTSSSLLKDSTYHLLINDDASGMYFKIVKVGTTTKTDVSGEVYEVDIGYPTSTLVTGFDISTDNSWAVLYNYDQELTVNKYKYSVDDNGQIMQEYSPSSTALISKYGKLTEVDKTWWTKMTQFPITATLTIKGLLRPAILMEYVRINTFFYGQKHISSGMYVITKQEDKIDGNGYRTTLSLTRVSGDSDEFSNISSLVTTAG